MEKYDLIIVGAGPSGVFCAYELIKKNKLKNVLIIEQGKRIHSGKKKAGGGIKVPTGFY